MDADYDKVREAALKILERRRRTRRDVETRLAGKGFGPEPIRQVCDRLEELRLLDDREFARLYLEGRRHKPRGARLLLQELRAKGVPQRLAEELIEESRGSGAGGASELERAAVLARATLRKVAGLPAREASGKLYQALVRRGFDSETASSAAREALRGRVEDEA